MSETVARAAGRGPALHVLMVHFNTPELLSRSVTSVLTTTDPQCTVHVQDNGSEPEAWAELVDRWEGHDRVSLRRSGRNVGFGGGVNDLVESIDLADDDIIWILNPDTVVSPGAAARCTALIRSGRTDVASPVLTSGPASARWIWFAGGSCNSRTGRIRHEGYGAPFQTFLTGACHETTFMTGAAPAMTTGTWRRVGGFRTDLFLYWEDVDWSERATAAGVRMAVAGDAAVWHAVGSTTGASPSYYYYNSRNRFLVCGGTAPFARLRFGVTSAVETARLVGRGLRRPRRPLSCAWSVLLGTVHGLGGVTGPR